MFLLDLYRFAESYEWFTVKHLAGFVLNHRECERLSRAANLPPKIFAVTVAKEFIGRLCAFGYLDLKNGVATCYGSQKRPFRFELRSLEGAENKYIKMMHNIGSMSDDELFKESAFSR